MSNPTLNDDQKRMVNYFGSIMFHAGNLYDRNLVVDYGRILTHGQDDAQAGRLALPALYRLGGDLYRNYVKTQLADNQRDLFEDAICRAVYQAEHKRNLQYADTQQRIREWRMRVN